MRGPCMPLDTCAHVRVRPCASGCRCACVGLWWCVVLCVFVFWRVFVCAAALCARMCPCMRAFCERACACALCAFLSDCIFARVCGWRVCVCSERVCVCVCSERVCAPRHCARTLVARFKPGPCGIYSSAGGGAGGRACARACVRCHRPISRVGRRDDVDLPHTQRGMGCASFPHVRGRRRRRHLRHRRLRRRRRVGKHRRRCAAGLGRGWSGVLDGYSGGTRESYWGTTGVLQGYYRGAIGGSMGYWMGTQGVLDGVLDGVLEGYSGGTRESYWGTTGVL